MQTSVVTVLYKKGDRNDLTNYRPISILPIFSKGFEKIIFKRVINFCTKFHIITKSQYGFMKGRSTETALLAQKEIILKSFEDKKLCIGIFVDFSKAFDRLCHYTLIEKLEMYGIRGIPLSLLKSYLKCRSQCVKINNYFSSADNHWGTTG